MPGGRPSLPVRARRASSRPPRSRPRFQWRELPWTKLLLAAGLLAGGIFVVVRWVDLSAVREWIVGLDPVVLIVLLILLPLVGFSVRLLHIAAGIRFGATWGMVIVSASILIQLLASFAIVRRWGERFERMRWVQRLRERIPQGAHGGVTLVALLLPGAPFTAINYVLPLVGVPLRTFLLTAWPIHTLRSTVSVVFGEVSAELTPAKVAWLAAYALAMAGASWWTYRRIQSRSETRRPAEDDRTPRG